MATLNIVAEVNLTTTAATLTQNTGLATLLIEETGKLPTHQPFKLFTDIAGVALDFTTTDEAFIAASTFFSNGGKELNIGSLHDTAQPSKIVGGSINDLTDILAITGAGEIIVTVNGTPLTVDLLDFTAVADVDAVIVSLNSAITTAGHNTTFTASKSEFDAIILTTVATGIAQDISLVSGISADALNLEQSDTNSFKGTDIETASTALLRYLDNSDIGFANVVLTRGLREDDTFLDTVQSAATLSHIAISNALDILNVNTTSDIASLNVANTRDKAMVTFDKTTKQYCDLAMYALLTRVDLDGINTTITLGNKPLTGVVANKLTNAEVKVLRGKNCSVYNLAAKDSIVLNSGETGSEGVFIDDVVYGNALVIDSQIDILDLFKTGTKNPYTQEGFDKIELSLVNILTKYKTNGFIAVSGFAKSSAITAPEEFLIDGYKIVMPTLEAAGSSGRTDRDVAGIQIAIISAGSTDTINATIALT